MNKMELLKFEQDVLLCKAHLTGHIGNQKHRANKSKKKMNQRLEKIADQVRELERLVRLNIILPKTCSTKYPSNEYLVNMFYDECCGEEPKGETATEELYDSYEIFCIIHGEVPRSKNSFCKLFAKVASGYKRIHTTRKGKTRNVYVGLGIKEQAKP